LYNPGNKKSSQSNFLLDSTKKVKPISCQCCQRGKQENFHFGDGGQRDNFGCQVTVAGYLLGYRFLNSLPWRTHKTPSYDTNMLPKVVFFLNSVCQIQENHITLILKISRKKSTNQKFGDFCQIHRIGYGFFLFETTKSSLWIFILLDFHLCRRLLVRI
jgi:hypothetical protein